MKNLFNQEVNIANMISREIVEKFGKICYNIALQDFPFCTYNLTFEKEEYTRFIEFNYYNEQWHLRVYNFINVVEETEILQEELELIIQLYNELISLDITPQN